MISNSDVKFTDSNVKFTNSEVRMVSRFCDRCDNAFVVIFFKTMYNKAIIGWGFCDIKNNQGRGKCNQPRPQAEADYTCRDLDYSLSQKPNSIIVLLYIVLKKIMANALSQRSQNREAILTSLSVNLTLLSVNLTLLLEIIHCARNLQIIN